jgi:crotonobetainyl-CoA:carnitine CoA-transferase CaiB-like acyl-CoA transferase
VTTPDATGPAITSADGGGILRGVKVVDFTHIFAGPFATQFLGDLGADVVKVERCDGGDAARSYGLEEDGEPFSGPFLALNRNKRSLALDLSTDQGVQVARDLVASADVVVENFREGVMAKWGLDYETLATQRDDLVYCSITGFGRQGELASKAANDLIIQAYSGLLSFTGEPGRPPVRCGTAISDFSAGLVAALGIVAALLERCRTGRGQRVETSLLESQVSMMSYFFAEYWLLGVQPRPLGTANRLGMPNQAFPTADGYVVITAANDRMWQRCCDGVGQPELAFDPRFATLADRYRHRDELVAELSALTRRSTTAEVLAELEARGVSCAPIKTVAEVAVDPQLEQLGAFVNVPTGADGGTARVIGSPLHLSRTPTSIRSGVPAIGEGSREILAEIGYSDERITELVDQGIVAAPP